MGVLHREQWEIWGGGRVRTSELVQEAENTRQEVASAQWTVGPTKGQWGGEALGYLAAASEYWELRERPGTPASPGDMLGMGERCPCVSPSAGWPYAELGLCLPSCAVRRVGAECPRRRGRGGRPRGRAGMAPSPLSGADSEPLLAPARPSSASCAFGSRTLSGSAVLTVVREEGAGAWAPTPTATPSSPPCSGRERRKCGLAAGFRAHCLEHLQAAPRSAQRDTRPTGQVTR